MTGTFVCSTCGPGVSTRVEERDETFQVKAEPITIRSTVRVCVTCGGDLFDETFDEANLQAAFDLYRARHHLLSPEEIGRKVRDPGGPSSPV